VRVEDHRSVRGPHLRSITIRPKSIQTCTRRVRASRLSRGRHPQGVMPPSATVRDRAPVLPHRSREGCKTYEHNLSAPGRPPNRELSPLPPSSNRPFKVSPPFRVDVAHYRTHRRSTDQLSWHGPSPSLSHRLASSTRRSPSRQAESIGYLRPLTEHTALRSKASLREMNTFDWPGRRGFRRIADCESTPAMKKPTPRLMSPTGIRVSTGVHAPVAPSPWHLPKAVSVHHRTRNTIHGQNYPKGLCQGRWRHERPDAACPRHENPKTVHTYPLPDLRLSPWRPICLTLFPSRPAT
jgi:hypothetical protein